MVGLSATHHAVVDQLHADGFAAAPRLLDVGLVEAGRAELDRLLHEGGGSVQLVAGLDPLEGKARKIKDVAQLSPLFLDIASSESLVTLVQAALECDSVRLFTSTAWMKPSSVGAPKPPHQDEAHWLHVQPSRFVTCWIAFDTATVTNGCLTFEPRSHRGPIHWHVRDGSDFVIPKWECAGVPVELEAGDASLHMGRTVHWSAANHSATDRRGVAFAYCRGDATSTDVDLDRLPQFVA